MRPEHLTLSMATNGTAATGTLAFNCDVIHGTPTEIRIPRGLALKIWSKHINGADVKVTTQFTKDITASPVVWSDFSKDIFVATVEGDRNIEKRRPLLFRGLSGNEAVRFSYAQEVAAVSGIEINIEICEIQ